MVRTEYLEHKDCLGKKAPQEILDHRACQAIKGPRERLVIRYAGF